MKKFLSWLLSAAIIISGWGISSAGLFIYSSAAVHGRDMTEVIGTMEGHWDNYFGTIEDNRVIQLSNELKLDLGMKVKAERSADEGIKDLHVIAGSSYAQNIAGSAGKYFDEKGDLFESDLDRIVNFRDGISIYKASGAEIRDFLEWSASNYAETGKSILVDAATKAAAVISAVAVTSDALVLVTSDAAAERDASEAATAKDAPEAADSTLPSSDPSSTSAVERIVSTGPAFEKYTYGNPENIFDVKSFPGRRDLAASLDYKITGTENLYIFDGITYAVNTSVPARFRADGTLKNAGSHRIVNLKVNGTAVSDADNFLFVTDFDDAQEGRPSFFKNRIEFIPPADVKDFVVSDLKDISSFGNINSEPDDNFLLYNEDGCDYAVFTSTRSAVLGNRDKSKVKWTRLSTNGAAYAGISSDPAFTGSQAIPATSGTIDTIDRDPYISAYALKEEEDPAPAEICIQINNACRGDTVKTLQGRYSLNSDIWKNAASEKLKGDQVNVEAEENGIYSILLQRADGRRFIRYLRIKNINAKALKTPIADEYYNTSENITGIASPGVIVCFECPDGKVYSTVAGSNGTFKYALPGQKAGTNIYLYASEEDGSISQRRVVSVKRNGPNMPSLDQMTTKTVNITGNINDEVLFPVLVTDKTVYVSDNSGIDYYKSSAIYDANKEIEEIPMNIDDDGTLSFQILKALKADDKATLYTLDLNSRVSRGCTAKVVQTKPAKPFAFQKDISNKSKKTIIYSYENVQMTVTFKGKTYKKKNGTYVKAKKAYKYKFSIKRTDSGKKIKAFAENNLGKSGTKSFTRMELVPDTPEVNNVYSSNRRVSGKVDLVGAPEGQKAAVSNTKTKVYVVRKDKKKKASIASDGSFSCTLSYVKSGEKIEVYAENLNGKSMSRTVKVR
ncbi:MAG: hypothetical protein VZR00_00440 [Lachnospiraceae bacterium]|nr:hypothetical protein [Lachnospiraceae bacterium]MEE3460343.1 hypothetical protein [Lachnospiraceae bacterium]